ncbi:Protein F59C6.8 [Aphelenchoides avenae]|nr:Protein F59C6.8 [Aphelenchus avenae]
MPAEVRYFSLIEKCYERIFYQYKLSDIRTCPGPARCEVPPVPGLKCAVSKRITPVQAVEINHNLFVHRSTTSAMLVTSFEGCSL